MKLCVSHYDGQYLYEVAWDLAQGIVFLMIRAPFGAKGVPLGMWIDIPGTVTLPKSVCVV